MHTQPSNRFLLVLLCLISSVVSWSSLASKTPQKVVLLTDKNLEPFSYLKGDAMVGKTIDWVKRIDEVMPDYEITIKGVDWKEGLLAIREGRALGIIGTYFSGSNRAWIYPYSQPLFNEQVVVVCNPNVKVSEPINWPTSFRGLLVLNIAGYDGWLDFKVRHRKNTEVINFFEVPTVDIAYKVLKKGNADCMLSEKTFAELAIARDSSDESQKPKIKGVVSRQPIYVGYSHKAVIGESYPYALDFARAFDFAQYQLKREGELKY